MTIAFYTADNPLTFFGTNFYLDVAIETAKQQPSDCILLLVTESFSCNKLPDNCKVVRAPAPSPGKLSYFLWIKFKLPQLIRKYRASVFITSCTAAIFNKQIRQFINIEYPNRIRPKKNRFLFSLNPYPAIDNSAIIPFGLPICFSPANFTQKEEIKTRYSQGCEYFFSIAPFHEAKCRLLLKAFSHFKKWQKSNLKLVIMLTNKNTHIPLTDFDLYKFKEDVIWLFQPEDCSVTASLISAAYASLTFDYFGVIAAGKCSVPCIYIHKDAREDVSILQADENEVKISKPMIMLYKDENYRNECISLVENSAKNYTSEAAAMAIRNYMKAYL